MRFPFLIVAALYGVTTLLPSPATAGPEAAAAAAAEVLPRLTFQDATPPVATTYVADPTQGEAMGDLAEYAGKPVVLNFWATWCAPCKAEMPSLQALSDARDDIHVVTVAFGRHNPAAMQQFWAETGVTTLPLHLDAKGELARGFGVRGLPHTVLLDADGQVIAQFLGESDWNSDAVHTVLDALGGSS